MKKIVTILIILIGSILFINNVSYCGNAGVISKITLTNVDDEIQAIEWHNCRDEKYTTIYDLSDYKDMDKKEFVNEDKTVSVTINYNKEKNQLEITRWSYNGVDRTLASTWETYDTRNICQLS